jgi:tripeptidyl-peptidase-1
MEVSDPRSSRYGQHLSVEEVHDLFAPSQETVDNVRAWLESEGISASRISQSFNKQFLQFDASAAEVERLLNTEYYLYQHAGTGRSHIACREYHVLQSVQRHIDYITPGIKLLEVEGVKRTRSIEKRSLGSPLPPILEGLTLPLSELLGNTLGLCDIAVMPACVHAIYNISEGTKATKGNELGIFEDLGDVYSQEDLDLFFSTFAPCVSPYCILSALTCLGKFPRALIPS